MNERIKQAFNKMNITAYKAAKDIGIGRSLIGKYMSGESEPSVSNIKLIADYLNISLEWLIRGKGEMCINPEENKSSNYSDEISQLKQEVEELKTKLKQAEYIIELQKRIIDGEDRAVKVNKNVG